MLMCLFFINIAPNQAIWASKTNKNTTIAEPMPHAVGGS
jgi:hypothetical protein